MQTATQEARLSALLFFLLTRARFYIKYLEVSDIFCNFASHFQGLLDIPLNYRRLANEKKLLGSK
jgi:hypothetical protein